MGLRKCREAGELGSPLLAVKSTATTKEISQPPAINQSFKSINNK